MTKFIAHRGASAQAPENTMSAFKLALENKADFVEFDVRLSKDGIPVILHDPTIKEAMFLGKEGNIDQLTLDEIQKWNVGSIFNDHYINEKIPAFQEIFDLDWKQTGLMIEIKECKQPDLFVVNAVFDVLKSISSPLPKIVIGSFSPSIVHEIQCKLREHPLEASLIGIVEEISYIDRFIELGVDVMAVWEQLITNELVDYLHNNGIDIWVFTVDDCNRVKELISLQIDGIITNDLITLINKK